MLVKEQDKTLDGSSRTGPVGRALRFLVGTWLVALTFPFYGSADPAGALTALGLASALVAIYASIHLLVWTFLPNLNRYLGALLCWAPAILVYSLAGAQGRVALLSYIGASLLLAGVRAGPGCEVMSIPDLTFKKHTHLACICFSPVDWLEAKVHRHIGRAA